MRKVSDTLEPKKESAIEQAESKIQAWVGNDSRAITKCFRYWLTGQKCMEGISIPKSGLN